MIPTLDTYTANHGNALPEEIVAVIDAPQFEAARQDQRVRSFLAEADAYLVELEQQGRNR
jgi:hypothetical protein